MRSPGGAAWAGFGSAPAEFLPRRPAPGGAARPGPGCDCGLAPHGGMHGARNAARGAPRASGRAHPPVRTSEISSVLPPHGRTADSDRAPGHPGPRPPPLARAWNAGAVESRDLKPIPKTRTISKKLASKGIESEFRVPRLGLRPRGVYSEASSRTRRRERERVREGGGERKGGRGGSDRSREQLHPPPRAGRRRRRRAFTGASASWRGVSRVLVRSFPSPGAEFPLGPLSRTHSRTAPHV